MSPYLENLKITTFTWTCIQVYPGSGGMEVLNYEINNSKAIKIFSTEKGQLRMCPTQGKTQAGSFDEEKQNTGFLLAL